MSRLGGRALSVFGFVSIFLTATATVALAEKPRYSEEVSGTILAVDGARWKKLADCTVRLVCRGERPTDTNDWHDVCSSELRVSRGNKVIAKLGKGILGVDYRAVAGNAGSVKLDLFDVDEASLIVVRSVSQEGDEQMRWKTSEQLFVVDGATLREVYAYDPLRAFDPGPDGADDDREKTTVELSVSDKQTRGLSELIVRTADRDGAAVESRLAWNGVLLAEPTRPVSIPITAHLVMVLAGKRLGLLDGIDRASLVYLRNAAYARHGRAFKNPSLQTYFYGPGRGAVVSTLVVNPAYSDAMLDAVDRANIAAVQAEEKLRAKH